jgi:hypothetical protein
VTGLPDELRLAAILALSAFVFVSALALSRQLVRDDPIQPILDAFLLTYLVQYVAVGVPGLIGCLSFGSIALVAIALTVPMCFVRATDLQRTTLDGRQRWFLTACALFVFGEIAATVYGQAYLPPLANDALTYHVPAAVSWLQSGRIGLYQTWFYNPANTYSPLGGSMFMAWLLAPIGNDALARFAQAPALLFVFVGMIQLCRALGANVVVAALIATGAVLSRPFVSQAILAKDDLFVAAFFLAALVGLARAGKPDRLVPWRIGIALGLLFSSKYTVWLSAPLFLLLIDVPIRARWRLGTWSMAIGSAVAIAAPWYVRNALLTSNPLYPTDLAFVPGMFATRRSDELASLVGLWKTFVTGYYSTTMVVALPLAAVWVAAIAFTWRRLAREPLVRACVLGPPVGILLFVLVSPYAEVRFVYPSLLLLFGCSAIVAGEGIWGIALAGIVAVAGVGTGFIPMLMARVLPVALVITVVGVGAKALLFFIVKNPLRRVLVAGAGSALVLACVIFVYWSAYLRRPGEGYAATCAAAWRGGGYPRLADAWEFVRALPPDAPVAYANACYTYPLYGFDLRRRVFYVPTRRDVEMIDDLDHLNGRLSGAQIQPAVVDALNARAERDRWLRRLLDSGAQFLFVGKIDPAGRSGTPEPPELRFARELPERFVERFNPPAGDAAVFEIRRP